MILKSEKMCISSDFKMPNKTLTFTKADIDALNRRIKRDIEQNEIERLRGLQALEERHVHLVSIGTLENLENN